MVLLRTSGAPHIGLGHLMRCLALAEAFAKAGWVVALYGQIPDFVAPRWASYVHIRPNHDETALEADWQDPQFLGAVEAATLVLTDLYALSNRWRGMCPRPVVAVSDPPQWPGNCRLAVMPTLFPAPGDARPQVLTAPEHCLISHEIAALRPHSAPEVSTTDTHAPRLLVSCGGGEDLGLAARCLSGLAQDPRTADIQGTVVLGALSPLGREDALAAAARLPGMVVRERVSDMASVLSGHALAVGTPAGAALERACLGMAQILVPIVENQRALAHGLARLGVAEVLPSDAASCQIADAVATLLNSPARQQVLGRAGWQHIDGRGAHRVVAAVERMLTGSLSSA